MSKVSSRTLFYAHVMGVATGKVGDGFRNSWCVADAPYEIACLMQKGRLLAWKSRPLAFT